MTELENSTITRLDNDVRGLSDRLIRVETKVDDAAETRDYIMDQIREARAETEQEMRSLTTRIGWLITLVVTVLLGFAGTVGGIGVAVNVMSADIEANQQTIRDNQATLERKMDTVIKQNGS